MSEELKPCPFCGKSNFTEEFYDKELVVCNPCDIGGDRANWQNRPIEDALRAENDRLTAEVARLTDELWRVLLFCEEEVIPYLNRQAMLADDGDALDLRRPLLEFISLHKKLEESEKK